MPDRIPAAPLLPMADIWQRAFTRQQPDPGVVQAFAERVRARSVLLPGAVRQELLMRARDERQRHRLGWILAGYPHVPTRVEDHRRAADLHAQHRHIHALAPAVLLHWAVAERLGATVWSATRAWQQAAALGAPVVTR